MASVNRVTLVGNLTKDPEMKYMQNGDAVCNFSVATNEEWKDKNSGEKKESVEFHRCTIYRRLGEIAGQYLKKGSQVYLEGKLQTRKWSDKDGIERYTTEVVCHEMKMLGSRGPSQDENQDADPPRKPAQERSAQGAQRTNGFPDDEIPFNRHGHGKTWSVV